MKSKKKTTEDEQRQARRKRRLLPADESTPSERAEWIGKEGTIKGKPVVYIDAVKWRGIWYIQYVESQPPATGAGAKS